MNEEEWLTQFDVVPILRWLRGRNVSDRKIRLFAVGCAGRFQSELPGPHFQESLEAAERYADAPDDEDRMFEPWDAISSASSVHEQPQGSISRAIYQTAYMAQRTHDADGLEQFVDLFEIAESVSRLLIEASQSADRMRNSYALRAAERTTQADLLRDIFGNPFRPVTLDPRWQSSTVLDLARTIYDQRTFENMPILGDATMDAGCDSDEIIQHCQGPRPHVRGCWVVDLLLGKE